MCDLSPHSPNDVNWSIRRILVVDDDEAFRERLAVALRRREYTVATASDGQEALRACETKEFDAAVVDLRMPGIDGLTLLAGLLRLRPKIRILILTGYGSIVTAVEAIRQGAHDYLTKPVDADRIEEVLLSERNCSAEPDPPQVGTAPPAPSLGRVEWEHIQRVLKDCGGNISEAARRLGIERRSLQRKLRKNPPLE